MIKRYFNRSLIYLLLTAVLASCAGTGTSSISMINLEVGKDESVAFFVRKKKYMASLGLVKVVMDGQEVGKLGIGEMERVRVNPGAHNINVSIGNILQLGTGSDATAFIAEKGKAYYFIVDYEQKLFSAQWTITETSAAGFKKALN